MAVASTQWRPSRLLKIQVAGKNYSRYKIETRCSRDLTTGRSERGRISWNPDQVRNGALEVQIARGDWTGQSRLDLKALVISANVGIRRSKLVVSFRMQ